MSNRHFSICIRHFYPGIPLGLPNQQHIYPHMLLWLWIVCICAAEVATNKHSSTLNHRAFAPGWLSLFFLLILGSVTPSPGQQLSSESRNTSTGHPVVSLPSIELSSPLRCTRYSQLFNRSAQRVIQCWVSKKLDSYVKADQHAWINISLISWAAKHLKEKSSHLMSVFNFCQTQI